MLEVKASLSQHFTLPRETVDTAVRTTTALLPQSFIPYLRRCLLSANIFQIHNGCYSKDLVYWRCKTFYHVLNIHNTGVQAVGWEDGTTQEQEGYGQKPRFIDGCNGMIRPGQASYGGRTRRKEIRAQLIFSWRR